MVQVAHTVRVVHMVQAVQGGAPWRSGWILNER